MDFSTYNTLIAMDALLNSAILNRSEKIAQIKELAEKFQNASGLLLKIYKLLFGKIESDAEVLKALKELIALLLQEEKQGRRGGGGSGGSGGGASIPTMSVSFHDVLGMLAKVMGEIKEITIVPSGSARGAVAASAGPPLPPPRPTDASGGLNGGGYGGDPYASSPGATTGTQSGVPLPPTRPTGTGGSGGPPLPPSRPTGQGLFIHRNGGVSGSASGGNLTITVEGGNAGWQNAVSDPNVDSYYTRAQLTILSSITKYVTAYNPNAVVNNDEGVG